MIVDVGDWRMFFGDGVVNVTTIIEVDADARLMLKDRIYPQVSPHPFPCLLYLTVREKDGTVKRTEHRSLSRATMFGYAEREEKDEERL